MTKKIKLQFYGGESPDLPPNPCGECTACCSVLAINSTEMPEINHAGHTPCKFCENGKGCGIYNKRPALCRSYVCGWRGIPDLNARPLYRPDKFGVLIEVKLATPDDPQVEIWLYELWEGALANCNIGYILTKYQLDRFTVREMPYSVIKDTEFGAHLIADWNETKQRWVAKKAIPPHIYEGIKDKIPAINDGGRSLFVYGSRS